MGAENRGSDEQGLPRGPYPVTAIFYTTYASRITSELTSALSFHGTASLVSW